jgi:hypothetical protein
MEESHLEKRHCRRLKLKENCTIQFDNHTIEVKLLELSPKGALIECENGVRLPENEKLKLSVKPDNSVVLLHFEGEVVYRHENLAGVSFFPITAIPEAL